VYRDGMVGPLPAVFNLLLGKLKQRRHSTSEKFPDFRKDSGNFPENFRKLFLYFFTFMTDI
jgi:hypothetical protein